MQESQRRAPRLLFIPVSSPSGIGEYIRSLSIAQSFSSAVADADIRFVLSAQAPYLKTSPFEHFVCPSSPTKHSSLVKKYVDEFQPDIVIFDASGRAEQLKHCKKRGIHTVFIGQHSKKINKGFSIRRLAYTDKIWAVQPSFAVKPLSIWSKIKLRLVKHCEFSIIGPIVHQPDNSYIDMVLAKYRLEKNAYILVNSGSGGHIQDGRNAAEEFARAAEILSTSRNEKILLIYGPNFKGTSIDNDSMTILQGIPAKEFAALLKSTRCALIAGGSALFQAIAYQRVIVCCAVSKDQGERIARCQDLGLAVETPLDAQDMAKLTQESLVRDKLDAKANVEDGLKIATENLIKICKNLGFR